MMDVKEKDVMLSVVVPVYNEEKYLVKCVDSILKQKYPSIEVILVDDGSTDRSGMICDLFAQKDERVKVLHTENGGMIKARLAGVRASKGERVTFVDADDWIDEYAYEGVVFDDDCDVVMTGERLYYSEGKTVDAPLYFEEGIYDKKRIKNEIITTMLWDQERENTGINASLWSKIFKKDILLKRLEDVSELGVDADEDSVVIYPMIFQVECIRISGKIYCNYRQRKEGEIAPYYADELYIPKMYKVYEYLKEQFIKEGYWRQMKGQLDQWYLVAIEKKRLCYDSFRISKGVICFPIEKIPIGSRVVLYGAGKVGKEYWKQNIQYHFCDIILWVDRNYERMQCDYRIEAPMRVKEFDFDYIIIAIRNYVAAKEVAVYLNELGIPEKKIVWYSITADARRLVRQ